MVTGGPGKIVQKRAGQTLQTRANTGKIVQHNPGGSLQERAKTGGKVQNNFAGSGGPEKRVFQLLHTSCCRMR